MPARRYPGGYQVAVTGATVASAADAPVLRLLSSAGADAITVTVSPAGSTASPLSPCPRLVNNLPLGGVLCSLARR